MKIIFPSTNYGTSANYPHRRKSAVELTASLKSNVSNSTVGEGSKVS